MQAILSLGAIGCMLAVSAAAAAGNVRVQPNAAVPQEAAPAVLFDRIVAWVDGESITQSELYAETYLLQVAAGGGSATSVDVPPTEAALKTGLQQLIGELLVAREARRVGAQGLPREEVDARLAEFASLFASQDAYNNFLQRLSIDNSFVVDAIARRLRNERYLNQRLRTRMASMATKGSRAEQNKQRQARFEELAREYGQELWRTVQVRLLSPSNTLERVGAER